MESQLNGGIIVVQGTPARQAQYLRTLQDGISGNVTVRHLARFFERYDRNGDIYKVSDVRFRQRLFRHLHEQLSAGSIASLVLADDPLAEVTTSDTSEVRCVVGPDGVISPPAMQGAFPAIVRAKLAAQNIASNIHKKHWNHARKRRVPTSPHSEIK